MTESNSMAMAGSILCGIVAFEHLVFFVMETFLWHSRGRKVFGMKADLAADVSPVIAQVGCYNLFLALGLVWALAWNSANDKILFLTFVWMAAAFGATSVQPRILLTQGGPAIVGLFLVIFGAKSFAGWNTPDNALCWILSSICAGVMAGIVGALWKRNDRPEARLENTS